MTTTNEAELQIQTLDLKREVTIAAPIEITWDAVLAELGPESEMPEDDFSRGKPFPFTLEAWPGGRWYRDLSEGRVGHLWGHVQVIKPPGLLEISGPFFLSYPGMNHLQYRLTAEGDGTRLKLAHRAIGYMPKEFMAGVEQGWEFRLKRIGAIAQRSKAGR